MEQAFSVAALWFGLALLATFLASKLKISMALMEILVGIAAAAVIGHFLGTEAMGSDLPWLKFLASTGAVLLTFLAGAELEPFVMRRKRKEVSVIEVFGFLGPFLGCTAIARFALGWLLDTYLLLPARALVRFGTGARCCALGLPCSVRGQDSYQGLRPVSGRRRVPARAQGTLVLHTLMMSTGLTFGTISALYGLSNGIVTQEQYSHLVAVVIVSAVVPTLVAQAVFLPRHILPAAVDAEAEARATAAALRRQAESSGPLEEG